MERVACCTGGWDERCVSKVTLTPGVHLRPGLNRNPNQGHGFRACVASAPLTAPMAPERRSANTTNNSTSSAQTSNESGVDIWVLVLSGLAAALCVAGIVWNCLRKNERAVVAAGSEGSWAQMATGTKWYDTTVEEENAHLPGEATRDSCDRVYPMTRQEQVNV